MKFEVDYIEKLAKIIADNELTEISLEDGEQAITIRKDLAEVVTTTVAAPAAAPAPVVCQTTVNPAVVEVEKEAPKGKAITSPMVGTFYSAPSPDADPFVEVGKTIAEKAIKAGIQEVVFDRGGYVYTGRVKALADVNGWLVHIYWLKTTGQGRVFFNVLTVFVQCCCAKTM